jgi:hypothetical protein
MFMSLFSRFSFCFIELLNMLSIEFSVFFVVSLFYYFFFEAFSFRKIFVCLLYTIKNDFSCGAVLRETKRVVFTAPVAFEREKKFFLLSCFSL